VQPHQEGAQQQQRDVGGEERPSGQRHDADLQPLDEHDQRLLVQLVRQLTAGGREQQKRQDEERTDHQPGQRRRQPAHLQLVGDQHGEGEFEEVVVGRAEELRPEKRRETALAQQGELTAFGGVRWGHGHG